MNKIENIMWTLRKQAPVFDVHFANDKPFGFQDVKLVPDGNATDSIRIAFSSNEYCAAELAKCEKCQISVVIQKLYNDLKSLCESKVKEALAEKSKDVVVIGRPDSLYGNWGMTTTGETTFRFYCAVSLKLA